MLGFIPLQLKRYGISEVVMLKPVWENKLTKLDEYQDLIVKRNKRKFILPKEKGHD